MDEMRTILMMKKFVWAMVAAVAVGLMACGGKAAANGSDAQAGGDGSAEGSVLMAPVEADADSLFGFVETQVGFGPRTPGSDSHAACRRYLIESLKRYGVDTVMVQAAPVTTWKGEKQIAWNILGRINPGATDRILLLAHYDTRPWADEDPREEYRDTPIDGANDGASGVAVLLETARCLQKNRPDSIGIDLLLVDMEDSGRSGGGDEESWCLGTQKWVEAMPYVTTDRPMYGILLDMVGGKDAVFHREYLSQTYAKSIVDKVWALANASGHADRFPNSMGGSVIDDHLYVNQAGIPCVDIIESSNPHTGSFNPTWHTTSDNLASIDRETLRVVTQVVLNLLYREDGKI